MKKIATHSVSKKLIRWGQDHYVDYPWRDVENPWLALLAEVLLQRTSARQVCKHFETICQLFPEPRAVLSTSLKDLSFELQKFGFSRRAKTFTEAAYYFDSQDYFPVDAESLREIYGVGHYTAAAYLSLHMNVRDLLVDSNVSRWLSRMTGCEKPVDVRRCGWLWYIVEDLTPMKGFRAYNYAVLDFTMTICKSRNPDCQKCPIKTSCRFWQSGKGF